jgi:phage-related protein (TIGR01555 family)
LSKTRIRVNKHGIVQDGLSNVVASLGAASPKFSSNTYTTNIDPAQADMAFRTSTWYGKILTIPADDAVKEFRRWQATKDQIEKIESEEKRLRYRHVLHRALIMSRHEGGALIVPGGLPGSNSSPLDIDSVDEGSIKFLHVLSKDEVVCGTIDRDPMSENYGRPQWWELRSMDGTPSVRLHHSRAVPINGRHVPGGQLRRHEFWGDSVWLHLADAVIAADSGHAIISALMHEAKIDVITIPGLAAALATDLGEQAMTRRWQLAAQLKSISSIMLIDGGPDTENAKAEVWNQKQMRWDGLSDVMRMILTILSGAADIPYTRLTGDQQKGLSNNDEGSMRNYFSAVKTQQVLHIEPMLEPLDRILLMSAIGEIPDDVWYTWNDLSNPSDREKAEVDKIQAETVEIYQRTAMVPDESLAEATQNRMVESGRWPGLEKALEKAPEDWEAGIGVQATLAELTAPAAAAGPSSSSSARPSAGGRGGAGRARDAALLADAAPRTLYVRRDVVNWGKIESWAKAQGVETTLGSDMHVTIAYSTVPLDWMKIPEPWLAEIKIAAGGPRMLDRFGPAGRASVILFRSYELEWRHQVISDAGAVWKHAEYQPHITFTYGSVPEGMEPYRGEIVLGPEIFEEVDENWSEKIVEDWI